MNHSPTSYAVQLRVNYFNNSLIIRFVKNFFLISKASSTHDSFGRDSSSKTLRPVLVRLLGNAMIDTI